MENLQNTASICQSCKNVSKFQGNQRFSQFLNQKKITKDHVILDIIPHDSKLIVEDEHVTNTPFKEPNVKKGITVRNCKIEKLQQKQFIEAVVLDNNNNNNNNKQMNRQMV